MSYSTAETGDHVANHDYGKRIWQLLWSFFCFFHQLARECFVPFQVEAKDDNWITRPRESKFETL